jgi:ribonuclease D
MCSPQILHKNTPKALISSLPRLTYDKNIIVIISEAEAQKAVDVLSRSTILGIDTETRPSFKKGISHRVALLQIANEEICFLFRLNRIGLPPCLVSLLERNDILKVGLSLKDDFMMLHGRCDFTPNAIIDLQPYVKSMGIADMSLQKLYANVFGKRISKSARLSNWEADSLTEAQKQYAAIDAHACLQLYLHLETLQKNGNYIILEDSTEETSITPQSHLEL